MKKRLTLSIFAILLLTILITALSSVRNVSAVSNTAVMYLEAEGSGKITGNVGQAINIGDTSATFEVSGTPYMGSSNWLLIAIPQSVFDGNDDHKNSVEVNNGIQMSITRTNSNVTLKMSPASLKINGSAGSTIAHKELTVTVTGGNFIVEYPADKDVSDWFRGSDWIMNYEGEYMTAKLPEGMTVKLKKAVKIGDTSLRSLQQHAL